MDIFKLVSSRKGLCPHETYSACGLGPYKLQLYPCVTNNYRSVGLYLVWLFVVVKVMVVVGLIITGVVIILRRRRTPAEKGKII